MCNAREIYYEIRAFGCLLILSTNMTDHSLFWDEFPEDLQEEILSWLPVEYLCRFRCVSKQWNDVASSTKFITGLWAEQPRAKGRNPWLLLYNLNECGKPCAGYCFSTQKWKTFLSLSFIEENENKVAGGTICCHGSAAGLLLVEMKKRRVYSVCNPLTQKSFQLPAMKSIARAAVIGIVQDGPGDNGENYKVVAVGRANNRRGQIVEIYDSCEKIWNIVGFLPDDMQVWTTLAGMVFSNDDGFFYCEGNSRDGRGIIGFSIRDGTSIFVPLPEYNVRFFFSKLFTCGSRVLILAGILRLNEDGINDGFSDVIMWEFQNGGNSSSSRWNEIVRMPSSLVEDVYRIIGVNGIFYSVGMGDYVCIKSHYRSNRDVLVYNFILNSWSWLSTTCPLQHMRPHVEYSTTIFEPRPDMKVG